MLTVFQVWHLSEQFRQHGRGADLTVRDLNCQDLQGLYINAEVELAPLAAVVRAVFLAFAFAFAQHLGYRSN